MAKKLPDIEQKSGSLFDESWGLASEGESSQVTQEIISRGISPVAVAAFVLGVVSLLAFVHVAFAAISVLAILFALFAFYSISRSGGEITGKTVACLGLAIAIMSCVGGPFRKAVYRMEFEKQADAFCDEWFKTLKNGDFVQLHQMMNPYWMRSTIMNHQDEVNYFARVKSGDEEPHHNMHSYLSNPTLMTIWALGDKAKHSFYTASSTWLTNQHETTERIYAVTVEPDPEVGRKEKQTFFIRLVCNRKYNQTEEGDALVGWSVSSSNFSLVELDDNGRPIYKQEDL